MDRKYNILIWNKGLTKETSEQVKKISERNTYLFKYEPERFLERNKKISEKLKGRVPWNKGLKLGKQSKDFVQHRTRNSKNKRSMINYYRKKHPFLFLVEEIRENKSKELEGKCKKCDNFFVLKKGQLSERIRALENQFGVEENNFYCSKKCKNSCDIYRKRNNNMLKGKTYTQNEYTQFRKFVLERDNYICQYCGNKATIVHHEKPQKLEPFFALDPDYGWSCCKKCHYKYAHKNECSTGSIANRNCLEMSF